MAGSLGDSNDANARLEALLGSMRSASGTQPSNAPGSSFLTQIASPQLTYPSNLNVFQPQPTHIQHGYYHPSVSSALPTPTPPFNQPPLHSSAVMSPAFDIPQPPNLVRSGSSTINTDARTTNLLNLLRFNTSTSTPSPTRPSAPSPPQISSQQGQGASSSPRGNPDLLAALMGTSASKENKDPAKAPTQLPASFQYQFQGHNNNASSTSSTPAGPSSDTQAYLLQLLNRPKPAQTDLQPEITPANVQRPSIGPTDNTSDDLANVTKALKESTLVTDETSKREPVNEPTKTAKPRFTYVNPFEELHSTSPRNVTPQLPAAPQSATPKAPMQILKPPRHNVAESGDHKRKGSEERTPATSPARSKQKISSLKDESSPTSDDRSKIEALLGIGKGKETVSEALNEVGDQVNKEVEEALARAEAGARQQEIVNELRSAMDVKSNPDTKVTVAVTSATIEKDVRDVGGYNAKDDELAPAEAAVESVVEDLTREPVADNWDAATEDGTAKSDIEEKAIKVYNFPLKAFISITLKPDAEFERPRFTPDTIMAIARLRKEFDQVDRTLVTATNTFIIYNMSKNGGIRVIRQDSGRDKKVFDETLDRIFNVSASVSGSDGSEAVIGTGISGAVYWAATRSADGEIIQDLSSPKNSFILPPIQSPGEETPGGVLKTRARKSWAHPEFFAVGRGKSIHIVWPYVITEGGYLKSNKDRVVDTEKYLNYRSLKINTGKAGKDFTFSQDDTTVVSLDKAGRVKFWDIRSLINPDQPAHQSIEIKEPLLTLNTTPPNEKSWPTSIIFVDKLRPYARGGALRYLIVGMEQNHTLQLWDIALGKPVQELHLPHDKESDAVCSVVYHASSGVLVVGHPTRNSIYFIHLSTPRYNLPKSICQAEYIERIVNQDPTLPNPESTAVMSGIREYSFTDETLLEDSRRVREGEDRRARGDLRSLDILQIPASSISDKDDPALFELYAMHSTGVTCLSIKQDTLGWDKNNRALHTASALDEGLITSADLKPISSVPISESNSVASTPRTAPRTVSKEKEVMRKPAASSPVESSRAPEVSPTKASSKPVSTPNGGQESATSGAEKVDKKKKKKSPATTARGNEAAPTTNAPTTNVPIPSATNQTVKEIISRATNGATSSETSSIQAPVSEIFSQEKLDKITTSIEDKVSAEVSRLFLGNLDKLYQRFDNDKRTQQAVGDAKQEALLRLVSTTLSENVDQVLAGIVERNMQKIILPSLNNVVNKSIDDSIKAKLGHHIDSSLPKHLQKALPDALSQALQKPAMVKAISDSIANSVANSISESVADSVAKKITSKVEGTLLKTMEDDIIPSFVALSKKGVQKAMTEMERHASEHFKNFQRQSQADSVKIEQLSMLVTGLTETVSSMAAAQSKFQGEFLKVQQSVREKQVSGVHDGTSSPQQGSSANVGIPTRALEHVPEQSEEDELRRELQTINDCMQQQDFKQALMNWFNSPRNQTIFELYFSRVNPDFLVEVSPLLLMSVGASLTENLNHMLVQRLVWLEAIFQALIPSLHSSELEDVRFLFI
jgi:hypothetical protein